MEIFSDTLNRCQLTSDIRRRNILEWREISSTNPGLLSGDELGGDSGNGDEDNANRGPDRRCLARPGLGMVETTSAEDYLSPAVLGARSPPLLCGAAAEAMSATARFHCAQATPGHSEKWLRDGHKYTAIQRNSMARG